eukprot:Colp12_sorted_trinity150504_noHs@20282
MSVILETSLGNITIDLHVEHCPNTCLNFLKLCKIKYYNFCLIHTVLRDFSFQTGDPTGTKKGGSSIWGELYGPQARYFEDEIKPFLKHRNVGTVSMANAGKGLNASQFFITTAESLDSLDGTHTVFGQVVEDESFVTLSKINDAYCDNEGFPFQDIRIMHTIVLDDPFPDPKGLEAPDQSPIPDEEKMASGRIPFDDTLEDLRNMTEEEIMNYMKEKDAKSNAVLLEMIGDLPDADIKPPDNVLFVCKLNPVTRDEDLELIFSRFGKIVSCEIIKDRKTGDSLGYGFIEFEDPSQCEEAFLKMENVLIDDRRIHVDFSQSVSKLQMKQYREFSSHAKKTGRSLPYSGDSRPSYELKSRGRTGDNYDMVFDARDYPGSGKSKDSKPKKDKDSGRDRKDDRDRDRDRNRDRDSGRDRDRDRGRDRDGDRDRDRNRDKDKRDTRDRSRERKSDKRDRSRDRSRDRTRDRSRDKYREKDRDRRPRSRSPSRR